MTSKPPDAIAIGREIMDEDREVLAALAKSKVPDAVIEAMGRVINIRRGCFGAFSWKACVEAALAKAESMGWTLQPSKSPESNHMKIMRQIYRIGDGQ